MSNKRYNVLWVSSWYPETTNPVAGIFVREHARAVSAFDNITVLHLLERQTSVKGLWNFYKENSNEIDQGIPTYHLRTKHSPLPYTTLLIYMLGTFNSIVHLRKQGTRMDLIHAHIYRAGFPAAFVAAWLRIPLVLTEHSSIFSTKGLSRTEIIKAHLTFHSAKTVLPVSNFLKHSIQAYGFRLHFKVIGNTYDPEIFYFSPAGIRENNIQIITVASLTPGKKIDQLICALANLPAHLPPWTLRIIGDGPQLDYLQSISRQLGIDNKIEFLGTLTKVQVADQLRRADFFVLPSLYETFSVATLEALACGLPVLVTKSGGPEEYITEDAGILIPPNDPVELINGLIHMLTSSRNYSREKIASNVREGFSFHAIGTQIHNIYSSLLN